MPWRAKCYECQQEAGISRPFFETKELFLAWTLLEEKILEKAVGHADGNQWTRSERCAAQHPCASG